MEILHNQPLFLTLFNMKTILLFILLPLFVTAQHALSKRNEYIPKVPSNFPLCQSCCNINSTDPYKAVIQHYDNLDDVSGTPTEVTLPADNYYLLWEDDGTSLDTIWGNQGQGHIFRKQDPNGNWYFPKWLVNIEPIEIALAGTTQQEYGTQNLQSSNGENQILLTQNTEGLLSSACLYGNGKNKYGYWEARIKVTDASKGTFPTFWLFSSLCEKSYVEIDICDFALKNNQRYGISSWESESSGRCDCYSVYGTQIRPTMLKGNMFKNINFSDDYFIYGVDWRPDSVIYYLNRDRILATPNIANNAPVRTIFELKVKQEWNLQIPANEAFIYHIDWIKYYKRREDMNLMLCMIPSEACVGKEVSVVLNDFVEGAYFTLTGIGGNYVSPIISAQNEISTVFPTTSPAIYTQFDFGNKRTAWHPFVTLKAPIDCISGVYTLVMHLPNVPESECPRKEINIIDIPPSIPTDITAITKGTSIIDYKCILSVDSINSNLSYSWNIDSFAQKSSLIIKKAGTYEISVSAINSCGASLPYIETVTCTSPPPCDDCIIPIYSFSPNPTVSGHFLLESGEPIARIELYDVNGKQVFHEDKSPTLTWEIYVEYLTQGIYQVVLYGENQVFHDKIVINR